MCNNDDIGLKNFDFTFCSFIPKGTFPFSIIFPIPSPIACLKFDICQCNTIKFHLCSELIKVYKILVYDIKHTSD